LVFAALTPRENRAGESSHGVIAMADPRTEWGKELLEKLDALTAEFKQFREVEFRDFKEMSQTYFTTLDVIKWATGLVAAVILISGIGGAFYVNASIATANASIVNQEKSIVELKTTVTNRERDVGKELGELKVVIANQEREIAKELAKHGRDIGRLEGIIDTLSKENKKLAGIIQKYHVNLANVKVLHGTMLSMKGEKLEFMSANKLMEAFLIDSDTRIVLNGKEANVAELYQLRSVPVHVYLIGRTVIMVEVEKDKVK
jgi:hypothetical protein